MTMQGTWTMSDAGNMAEFMEKLGVAAELREKINSARPSLDIAIDGNNVMYKTVTPEKTREIPFTFGVEFETHSLDGKPVKCMVVKDCDTKWVESQKTDDSDRKVIRELVGDQMVITIQAAGHECVVKYTRA